MSENLELKKALSCPHCEAGKKNLRVYSHRGSVHVDCSSCWQHSDGWRENIFDAINSWNSYVLRERADYKH